MKIVHTFVETFGEALITNAETNDTTIDSNTNKVQIDLSLLQTKKVDLITLYDKAIKDADFKNATEEDIIKAIQQNR